MEFSVKIADPRDTRAIVLTACEYRCDRSLPITPPSTEAQKRRMHKRSSMAMLMGLASALVVWTAVAELVLETVSNAKAEEVIIDRARATRRAKRILGVGVLLFSSSTTVLRSEAFVLAITWSQIRRLGNIFSSIDCFEYLRCKLMMRGLAVLLMGAAKKELA